MGNKALRWIAIVLLGGMAVAQAPVVPTDRYGPPVCSAAKPAAHKSAVEIAREEQQQGASDPAALLSDDPFENFGVTRYRVADYADCSGKVGCYWADLDAQYKRAEAKLAAEIATKKAGEKLAVVMDIDETSLSGYCELKREDFGYIGSMFNAWVVSPEAAVGIPGGVRLFDEAKAAGIAVFFITGRPETQAEATAKNLEAAGYHGWAGLVLRNEAETAMPTIEYKSSERKKIAAKGYRIALSVGDQWSDLLGAPKAEASVKLPNPFYFLP